MIRKFAMLGLVAGFLALGGCDWCDTGCATEGATEGAALNAVEGDESCGECLEGCESDVAADATAGDAVAAPAVCPMSGSEAEASCGVVDKESCGMVGDCNTEAEASCETEKPACDTPCDEKPAAPQSID
jgi:hypothetical protein